MATKIEWCQETWNPITGCSAVSAGCDNCYARRMANRLRGRYGYPRDDPFKVTLHPDRLEQPCRWRKPRMIFCCSMGDFFHPQVPLEFQARMLNVMVKCPQHIFIILTKRHKQLAIFNEVCGWSAKSYPNIWLLVSAENQQTLDERVVELLKVDAVVRGLSLEPMLGLVDIEEAIYKSELRLPESDGWGVDWVICGGETGPGARPMNPQWARQVRDQCVAARVPFFFKSWGEWLPFDHMGQIPGCDKQIIVDGHSMFGVGKKQAGRLLDGKEYNEFPEPPDD